KFSPSLHAPKPVPPLVENVPIGERSDAFHNETLLGFATRMRSPSNAADDGPLNPLPVSVARTAPVDARTTVTVFEVKLGTQMFVPSKAGYPAKAPVETVMSMLPPESSFLRVPPSDIQMFAPSK